MSFSWFDKNKNIRDKKWKIKNEIKTTKPNTWKKDDSASWVWRYHNFARCIFNTYYKLYLSNDNDDDLILNYDFVFERTVNLTTERIIGNVLSGTSVVLY